MLNRRGPVSKLVGGTIGLAKEFQASRNEQKAAKQAGNDQASSSYTLGDEDFSDDEEWAQDLDEIQALSPDSSNDNIDVDQLLQTFNARHPPPPYSVSQTPAQLPMLVILPQRRPESRHRGFVRAYAPILEDVDIDQATWLDFLFGFEKSIKASPWFHVVNAGVAIADQARTAAQGVSAIATVVTLAIHVSLEASRRTYIHYKQNKYLDAMNESFFKPRGLYCLVIKYKPTSDQLVEDVDIEHNVAEQIERRDGQSTWKNLVSATSSTTKYEAEIPEPAPLIFPELDSLDEKQKENAVKKFGNFLADYYDRQAAAKFEAQNPDTKIPQVPRKEFASRYSDPNHPASTGGLVSVITGGTVNPSGGVLARKRERRSGRRSRMGIDRPAGKEGRQQRRENRPLKRLMKQDALYLMVVNLPTQEEMDRVLAAVSSAQ